MSRRFPLCVILAAVLLLASAADPVRALSSVSVEGTVVTITVPIDVFGDTRIRDPETGVVGTAGPYWETGAEQIWNDGLAPFRYLDCVTFKLDIDIKEFASDASGRPDAHSVRFYNDPTLRSKFWDPGAPTSQADAPTAFMQPLDGEFGPIDHFTVAHEVGHLLGLGDDYVDVVQPDGTIRSEPLDGRPGTLMAESESANIDQAVVDRIGMLLDDLGKLPECWAGTLTGSWTTTTPQCPGSSFEGKIELMIEATEPEKDPVKGTISIAESVVCLGFPAEPFAGSAVLGGTFDGAEFLITSDGISGGVNVWGCFDVPPIPASTFDFASAEWTNFFPPDSSFDCSLDLDRSE